MFDALIGKVEDPQMMLEQTYAELHCALIQARNNLNRMLDAEARIRRQIAELEKAEALVKVKIETGEAANEKLNELNEDLKKVQAEIAKLRRKLSDLEDEVRKAYTKKQVLIARDKAGQATLLATDAILVGKAITEDGLTYDHEISCGSERASKDKVPIWFPILMLTVVLILLMAVVLNGQPLHVFDFANSIR